MGAQGTALGAANMWALLVDKDPGHSAAASDLAVDVVNMKLKKAKLVKVEKAPPAGNIAKPANGAVGSSTQAAASKHGDTSKKMKKVATECSKQTTASAAIVHGGGKVKIDGAAGDIKQAAEEAHCDELTLISRYLRRRYLLPEETSTKKEEQEFTMVTARDRRRRTVTPCKAAVAQGQGVTVTGANMWALLKDEDTGDSHTAFVDDAKQERAAEVEEADDIDGTTVGVRPGPVAGAKPMKQGKKTKTKKTKKKGEIKMAPLRELEEEEGIKMAGPVATGGSRFRTVASRLCSAAVAAALFGLYCHLPVRVY